MTTGLRPAEPQKMQPCSTAGLRPAEPHCPDADGFVAVTRPQRSRQRGRGRGRGRFQHNAPEHAPRSAPVSTKPDFSTYHLRDSQRQKIAEWLEHAAEDWFCDYMSVPPVLLSPGVAEAAIFGKWYAGLVDTRVANGLDTNMATSALMFRSCEHARAVLAEHDFLKVVATFANARVILAAQQARADPTKNTGLPIVDAHYAPFFAGIKPRLVPPYSCMCSDVIVRDDQILGAQEALLSQARAFVEEKKELAKDLLGPAKEGDWWKEMDDEERSPRQKNCEAEKSEAV